MTVSETVTACLNYAKEQGLKDAILSLNIFDVAKGVLDGNPKFTNDDAIEIVIAVDAWKKANRS